MNKLRDEDEDEDEDSDEGGDENLENAGEVRAKTGKKMKSTQMKADKLGQDFEPQPGPSGSSKPAPRSPEHAESAIKKVKSARKLLSLRVHRVLELMNSRTFPCINCEGANWETSFKLWAPHIKEGANVLHETGASSRLRCHFEWVFLALMVGPTGCVTITKWIPRGSESDRDALKDHKELLTSGRIKFEKPTEGIIGCPSRAPFDVIRELPVQYPLRFRPLTGQLKVGGVLFSGGQVVEKRGDGSLAFI